jgi:hypothetical protein
LNISWDVKPESTDLGDGGDFESTPESISGLISVNVWGKVEINCSFQTWGIQIVYLCQ